jgi:hypothetical protein
LFVVQLALQLVREVHDAGGEPRGVEDLEVTGVDAGFVTSGEGMTSEVNRQGSAPFELLDFGNHLVKRNSLTEITVHGVETGRTAGGAVRLRVNVQVKLGVHTTKGPFDK